MSTILSVARTRLRNMLREPVANQWSDARLNELISDANAELIAKMGRIRDSGWLQLQETVTLAANASSFSLTPGSNPTALTKALKGILFVEHQGTSGFWNLCEELREADEFRFRALNAITATGDVPPLYRLRRPNIVFLPIATADRTLRITYRPAATTLSSDSDVLDVPDERVPIVCTRAAIFAMAELGEAETQFDSAYALLEDEMFAELSHPDAEGRSLTVKSVEAPALFGY